jgi:transcriptional regulator with XRE-family HTH domain
MTAASLARSISVTPQAVAKWLKGGDIGFDVLQEVANHLGVNWVWLRYGDEALQSIEKQLRLEREGRFGQMRQELVEQVIANESRLCAALAILEAGVIEEDLITGKCYWSDLARQHLEAPPDLLPSHDSFRSLLSEENKPVVDDFYNRALLEPTQRYQVVFRERDAIRPKVTIVFQIYRNDAGQPVRMVGVTRTDPCVEA